ncbi:hypothetical protein PVAP13_2KG348097 [Panicum virgatum]|uniref:Uncharacterized protein n=1 Tax=Panicum virgatum TaxID=38727 RepID=A0A8T0W8I9_PANVG|nr:hypothetical protein PVAP13_2KG348097 [Panicum virgatum]
MRATSPRKRGTVPEARAISRMYAHEIQAAAVSADGEKPRRLRREGKGRGTLLRPRRSSPTYHYQSRWLCISDGARRICGSAPGSSHGLWLEPGGGGWGRRPCVPRLASSLRWTLREPPAMVRRGPVRKVRTKGPELSRTMATICLFI